MRWCARSSCKAAALASWSSTRSAGPAWGEWRAARTGARCWRAGGAAAAPRLARLGAVGEEDAMRPQLYLEGVAPPMAEPPELLARLRAWEPGGMGRWVLAGESTTPLSAAECAALAQGIDAFE